MHDSAEGRTSRTKDDDRDRETAVEVHVDARGVILDVSENCTALLGWNRSQLLNTPLTRVIPERFHDAHREGFRLFLETDDMRLEGSTVRLPAVHAVAGEVDVELELHRGPDGGPAVAIGFLEPVRDQTATARSALATVVQQATLEELPLDELLEKCLAVAAEQQGWSVAAVWWIDPWLNRLSAITTWEAVPGANPAYVEATRAAVFDRGEGLVGQVWATGSPTFHQDLATEVELLREVSQQPSGLHGGLFFPLTARGETVGIVEMLDREERHFSMEDQEAVWVLADELGRLVADRLRREREIVRRERIEMALSAVSLGVWSLHIDSGILSWDVQLEKRHGLEPGSFGGSLADLVPLLHPDDVDETIDLLLAARRDRSRFDHMYRALGRDGSIMWLHSTAAPVTDADGAVRALTGVTLDVTDRIESQRKLDERAQHAALAADIGRALVGTDPLEVRLRLTVEAVVDRVGAAFARIWTVSPGSDTLELQASAGLYTHLDGEHSSIPVGRFKIGSIAAQKQPHLTNNVLEDPLISDPAWAQREGMVSFAGYPLVVGDDLVGVLGMFSRDTLPESTLSALAAIADTIAIAILQAWATAEMEMLIAHAQRTASEMEVAMRDRAHVAEVLQSSLLPPSLPDAPLLELGAAYHAGVEEVGGDFYDFLPLHEGWAFMIGDVCGRGPEAARLTALARHSLRTALLLELGPGAALAALNESLLAADADMRFCTVVCGTIDTASDESGDGHIVRLAVGGHPLPLVMGTDGSVRPVGQPGSLLGVLEQPSHTEVMLYLNPGETLVLYTDGVTEAMCDGELFGERRLSALLAESTTESPTRLVEEVIGAVTSFADRTADDLAVLAIRAEGEASRPECDVDARLESVDSRA